ncbi:MAG TPA: M1 family aminopeptidase [Pyrinomonadaceae bacterium]|nr:M1 family aminopeptidase [Pyrinomonadaceae bacterium]
MRTQSKLFLAVLIFTCVPGVFGARIERVVDTWKPIHYQVNIKLDPQLTQIESATTRVDIVAIKRLSMIDLDFGDLTIDNVSVDNRTVPFTHKNERIVINLTGPVNAGTKISVAIAYHGKPKDGLILSPDKDGKAAAVGDNWPNRVHHWIPSLDHPSAKASVTFNITASANNLVVANGSLDHVETTADGNRTWIYSEEAPIPPYCMIIGAGQFNKSEPSNSSLTPLSIYVPGSDAIAAQKGFSPANPILQYYSQTVGAYPYEKLALIVGNTRFGGMENSGAIVFATGLFTNQDSQKAPPYDIPNSTLNVVAHEIAHQWFGDSVTESTWSDLWLSEGFATYFAGLFFQVSQGEVTFQKYMKQASDIVFEYEQKNNAPIFDRETEDLFKLLNPNNYQKGAWVLHMLRSQLGDESFFKGIKAYYDSHKNGNATSEDLRGALEKASGKDLSKFFRRWIYESGHPVYKLSSQWNSQNEKLTIKLEQLQSGNPFLDPVPITIQSELGKLDLVLNPQGKLTTKTVPLKAKPATIIVDGNNTLLKEATTQVN